MARKKDKRITEATESDVALATAAMDLHHDLCSGLIAVIHAMDISDSDKTDILRTSMIMSIEALFRDDYLESFIAAVRNARELRQSMTRLKQ